MADENQTTTETTTTSNQNDNSKNEKKDIDFVPKTQYEEINTKYTRVDRLNQDLVKEREDLQKRLELAEQENSKFKSETKNSKIKGAKTPEEFQAILEEQLGTVTGQFNSKIDTYDKENQDLKAKLKELSIGSMIQERANGKIKPDMMVFLKKEALQQLIEDPANPNRIIVIDPATGNQKVSIKNPGQLMEAEEWLEAQQEAFPSMWQPKGVTTGTMADGQKTTTAVNGQRYTPQEYLQLRNTFPREQRVKLDKEYGF